jgi:hypothetical protein
LRNKARVVPSAPEPRICLGRAIRRNPAGTSLEWQARAATRSLGSPEGDLAGMVRQRQWAGEPTIMPPHLDTSRDLLFGLLALQIGLIDQG